MKVVRWAVLLLGVLVLLGSVLVTLAHVLTPATQFWELATAFTPYGLIGFAVALVIFGLVRLGAEVPVRRVVLVGSVVSLVGVVLQAVWLVPMYAGKHPTGKPALTVMELNMRLGRGDADRAVALATSSRAQVLVLEEVTPELLTRLDAAGLKVLLPYRYGRASGGASGTVISSAYPIAPGTQLPIYNGVWVMKVAAPKPFTLVAVHTAQPLDSPTRWRTDHATLDAAVKKLKDHGDTVIMAGDFNATLDHGPMRTLESYGLHDAAEQANSGYHPTWPTDGQKRFGIRLAFPLVAIDHVLTTAPYAAISTRTISVDHTDHKALIVRLVD